MELRHLRYFLAVAEEGHFTRAAERLGIQQPPLSQQIRALETELGFPLFERHAKGATLTAGGAAFFAEAQGILGKVEAGAARAALVASGALGHLRVGLTSSAAAHALTPRLLRRFRERYPQVIVEFREENASELTRALNAGELHAGILRQPVSRPQNLVFRALADEDMLLVLPSGHPALPRRRGDVMPYLSLSALRDESFIMLRHAGKLGMYASLVAACERAGFAPKVGIEVDRMLTIISLVAAGAGVSAVPASMRGFHASSVAYCKVAGTAHGLTAPLTLVYNAAERSPTLANFLEEAARGEQPGQAGQEPRPRAALEIGGAAP